MQSRVNDALLADWCLRYLGAPFERVLFRSGFLSEVVGVELPGGLRAVVKRVPSSLGSPPVCRSRLRWLAWVSHVRNR
jgi:hypothetical protein